MDIRTAQVNVDALQKLYEHAQAVKAEGGQLMRGNTAPERLAGSRIWSIGDKMDALLKQHVTPFGLEDASPSAPSQRQG
jgi:hypothetical protein